MTGRESVLPPRQWRRVEGTITFGNLVLEHSDQPHVVVCKSRVEFDQFLDREGITARDIDWGQP